MKDWRDFVMRVPRWLTVPAVAFLSTALFAALLVLAPRTPAAANEPCSVVVSGGEASLTWAPVDGVSTYVVRSMKPGESFKWRVTLSDEFSWTNAGHVEGEEYLIRHQPGPTDIPCVDDVGEPDNCVALQTGIPVIQSGAHYGGLISSDDAVWPAEAAHAASGGNVLYGYIWVPENWQVNGDGYHSLLHTGGTNHWARLDRQLDGTGTEGIIGYALHGNRHTVLDGRQLNGHSPRGEFPTLSHLPATADEHGGRFELVGLNIWRYGQYQYEATFTTSPRTEIPDAPYVEQPCYVYDDIVPGYGPNYNENFWSKLGLTEETAVRLLFIWTNPVEAARLGQEALVYVEEVLQGCVAAVAEFFESILEAAQLVEEFFRNPELFINTKIEEIRIAVEAAVADPENAVSEVLRQVLKLDLLRENPARWVGEVGCQILVDIVTGVAVAKVAERVLDFINTRRRDVDHGIDCNSFPAGTLVLMDDGTHEPIEAIEAGDAVLAYSPAAEMWTVQEVTAQWGHTSAGFMSTVTFEDGSSIESTSGHLYWTGSSYGQRWDWVAAEELQVGDSLRSPNGVVDVASVVTTFDDPEYVWELSVSTDHTFAVSSGTVDVVVHNAAEPGCGLSLNNSTHQRAVRDAASGTKQADLRDKLGQASLDDFAGGLKVQVHHIVPQALWRTPRVKPNYVTDEQWAVFVEFFEKVDADPELDLDKDSVENLIPLPSDAGQVANLEIDGSAWNPNVVHNGSHPGSYYDSLANKISDLLPSPTQQQVNSMLDSMFDLVVEGEAPV